ncbi:MAG: hypothetical protein QXS20_04645 [Candidatus Thorarchaeota archaeon]
MKPIRTTTLVYMVVLLVGMFMVPAVPSLAADLQDQKILTEPMDADRDDFPNEVLRSLSDLDPPIRSDLDLGPILQDRPNLYTTIFEPWKTKAAIHAVAYHEPTGFLALAGGYLYDNEIHIWRLNVETNMFDKVWDSGDSIIRSDVLAVAWGDTDLNNLLELHPVSGGLEELGVSVNDVFQRCLRHFQPPC